MIIIRPTSTLAKKLKVRLGEDKLASSARLGDWYAKDFRLGRKHFIMCVSSTTRLGLVLPAAPYQSFHERLKDGVSHLLKHFKINDKEIQKELDQMASISWGKTINRSKLGTLVDYVKSLEYYRVDYISRFDPLELSIKISGTPCVADGTFPEHEVEKIFSPLVDNILIFPSTDRS
jgi:hypothetical protein